MIFGKRAAAPAKTVRTFLDNADKAYKLSHYTRNIKPFIPYAESELLIRLTAKIKSARDVSFGVPGYSATEWELLEENGEIVRVKKRVTHDSIPLGHGMKTKIADDTEQEWAVVPDCGKVKEISPI
jgi:hypothetical protein